MVRGGFFKNRPDSFQYSIIITTLQLLSLGISPVRRFFPQHAHSTLTYSNFCAIHTIRRSTIATGSKVRRRQPMVMSANASTISGTGRVYS